MTINDIFEEYSSKGTKIGIRSLGKDMILIEGDSVGLEFLGHLLLALAKSDNQNSIQIGTKVAGSAFFTSNSTKGIYFHKIQAINKA